MIQVYLAIERVAELFVCAFPECPCAVGEFSKRCAKGGECVATWECFIVSGYVADALAEVGESFGILLSEGTGGNDRKFGGGSYVGPERLGLEPVEIAKPVPGSRKRVFGKEIDRVGHDIAAPQGRGAEYSEDISREVPTTFVPSRYLIVGSRDPFARESLLGVLFEKLGGREENPRACVIRFRDVDEAAFAFVEGFTIELLAETSYQS